MFCPTRGAKKGISSWTIIPLRQNMINLFYLFNSFIKAGTTSREFWHYGFIKIYKDIKIYSFWKIKMSSIFYTHCIVISNYHLHMTSELLVFLSIFQYTLSVVNHNCFWGERINQADFHFLLLMYWAISVTAPLASPNAAVNILYRFSMKCCVEFQWKVDIKLIFCNYEKLL